MEEAREWWEEFEAAARRPLSQRMRYAFIHTYKPVWTTPATVRSTPWRNIASGVSATSRIGLGMAAFDYRQAQESRDAFGKHHVRYLFHGNTGATLLGFPDTTQDAQVFVEKSTVNGDRLVEALDDLGFRLTDREAHEIRRGKDFIQLKNGPFDPDLVFAPDGIETFEDAWRRRADVERFPVCNIEISRQANRQQIA